MVRWSKKALVVLSMLLVVGTLARIEDRVVPELPEQEFVAEQEAAALAQQATLQREASLQKLSDERTTIASVRKLITNRNRPTVDQLLQDKSISDPQKTVIQHLMSLGSKYEAFLSWAKDTRKPVFLTEHSDQKVDKDKILHILDAIKDGIETAKGTVEATYTADIASISSDYDLAITRAQEGLDLRKFELVTSGTCASHNMREIPTDICPLAAMAKLNADGSHQTQVYAGTGQTPDGCLYDPETRQTYVNQRTSSALLSVAADAGSAHSRQRGDSFSCETQGNAEFDNDKCLRESSGFGASDTCASSVGKCTSHSKDMHRCCSKACSVTAVCSLNVCNALAGAGDCSSLPLDCGMQVDGTTYNCLCETPFDISTKTPSCEPQGVCMGVSGLAVGSEVCYSGSTANSADTCKQLNDVNTDFCSANGAGSTHCIRPQTVAEATVVAQDQKEADTPLAEKKKEDSKALLSAESTAEAKIRAKLPNLSKEVTAAQLMQGTGELSQSLFSMGDKYHVQAMSTQQLEKIPVQELLRYVERAIGHKEDSIKSQSAAGMDLI